MSFHISLSPELDAQLEAYIKPRSKADKSKVLRYALETLFSLEDLDPLKQTALKLSIEHIFSIPKHTHFKSFFVFLYLLSKNYPQESSRDFWTDVIYLSSLDKTHEEVYFEVKDDYSRRLSAKGNVENGKSESSSKRKKNSSGDKL